MRRIGKAYVHIDSHSCSSGRNLILDILLARQETNASKSFMKGALLPPMILS
jgi:hypothetical protein